MKILLVYPDFGAFGGIERYLLQLANGLRTMEPSLTFILACTQGGILQQQASASGLKTHGISVPQKLQPLFKKPAFRVFDLGSVWQLGQVVRQEKPDCVHVQIGQWENLWFRLWGIPMVYTFHGYGALYDWPSTASPLKRRFKQALTGLFKSTARAMERVIFVSHAERNRMQVQGYLPVINPEEWEQRFPVIHNGLDTQRWREEAARSSRDGWLQWVSGFATPSNPLQIVSFIDRLDENKNPLLFLDAIDFLLTRHPRPETIHVLVVGDGELTQAVRDRIQVSPYAAQIHALGRRDDIATVLVVSDLVIHPAGMEGFGLGVLEAMAVGTPCLAWPTGGIAELLDTPALEALKLKSLTPESIASQAMALLEQGREQLQSLKVALQAQASQFDEGVYLERMRKLYLSLSSSP